MYNKQNKPRKMIGIRKLFGLKKTQRSSSSCSRKIDATGIDNKNRTGAAFWNTAAADGRKRIYRQQQRRSRMQHRTRHQTKAAQRKSSTTTRGIIQHDHTNKSSNAASRRTNVQTSTTNQSLHCNVLDRGGIFGDFIHDGDSDDHLNDAEDTLYWAGLQGLS